MALVKQKISDITFFNSLGESLTRQYVPIYYNSTDFKTHYLDIYDIYSQQVKVTVTLTHLKYPSTMHKEGYYFTVFNGNKRGWCKDFKSYELEDIINEISEILQGGIR